MGEAFGPVEEVLREIFVPALFRGLSEGLPKRKNTRLLVKQAGIRTVGVGETWRRMMAKCLLRVDGPEAKAACGTTQLAGGLEAGIEGAIHAI